MTQKEVRALFTYESDGRLRRIGGLKDYPWRGIGRNRRYLATTISGKTYYAHRLVWLWHKGVMPSQVDHINMDTRDNRIENLRECTCATNQYNVRKRSHNTSGYKGVVYHKYCTNKPWFAKIVVNGKVVSLGYYPTPEMAAEAYAKGAIKYAGAFARSDLTEQVEPNP